MRSARPSSSPSSDDRDPLLEADHDLGRSRGARRIERERIRLLGRRVPGILEDAGLDRATEEVLVDRERRRRRLHDRDALRERVLDLLVPRPDAIAQRGDHLHARVVRLERELEAELVVALPGAAVDDGLGAEVERDLRDRLRDDRPRERRHERVLALVQRVREDRSRALLVGERLLAVDEEDIVGVRGPRPRDRLLEVELLADVDEHGDDLLEAVPVLLQPGEDAARVETARVGDDGGAAHVTPHPGGGARRAPRGGTAPRCRRARRRRSCCRRRCVPAIAGCVASSTACASAFA